MSLREGFEYGFAAYQDTEWCIRREGAFRMLCGRRHGFVPVAQPENPQSVHQECLEAYAAAVTPQPTEVAGEVGVCPACGTEQPVAGGRIQAHGGCPGVNMAPKGGSR